MPGKRPLLSGIALGLLALGSESGAGATDAWADILRTTLDADLAAARSLRDERLDARRATAALRFFGQILTVDSEAELTRALTPSVNAASTAPVPSATETCPAAGNDSVTFQPDFTSRCASPPRTNGH